MDTATEFRALHVPGDPLLLPNVGEFGAGAFLAANGFRVLGTTSLGVSAAAGEPDGAPATRDRTADLARRLARLDALVTVDIADGFSTDPAAVADLAAELAEAGVVGVNLEDGRPDGLADTGTQLALITAVKERVPGMFLNARTDTHWLGTGGADAAVERVRAYAGAGADGVFVPALAEPADVERVVAAAGVPVNLLFLPGKVTLAGLAALGVARVSLGSLPYRMALAATLETARAVATGSDLPLTPPAYADVTALLPDA